MTNRLLCLAASVLAASVLAACTDGGGPGTEAVPSGTAPVSSTAPVSRPATVSFTVDGNHDTAVSAGLVLRSRLAALGMNPDVPQVAGSTVTFSVTRPATRAEAASVTARGHLAFRPVVQSFPPAGEGPSPDADCATAESLARLGAASGGPDRDREQAVSCGAEGDVKYLLGPAELTGSALASATAEADGTGGGAGQWTVRLVMRDGGQWATVTEKFVGQQLAIVLDGVVHAAPQVEQSITDGSAQISGAFDESSARGLAAVLTSGTLPARVTVAAV